MNTLSFINKCFEEIGVAPVKAMACNIPEGDAPAEFGNFVVMLYRNDVAYDIDIEGAFIILYAPDPDGLVPPTPHPFRLTPLDWFSSFREWLRNETAEIAEAGRA